MTGTDFPQTEPPRTRTWVRVALVTSLALNLLILGIVGGAVLGHRDRPPGVAAGASDLGPYGRALDEADRMALRRALRAEAPRLRETRAAVRQGFAEVLSALRADPYDHGRVVAAMDAQQARVQDEAARLRGLMLDRVAAMSAAERAAFADRLERVLRRGPPREHGGGRP